MTKNCYDNTIDFLFETIPNTFDVPSFLFISPSNAEIKDDFPEPTDPTTPTNWPCFTVTSMFFNAAGEVF